jgi:L-aspartate oxidase
MKVGWRRAADVVVVGSGAAGITTALTAAARGLRVLMVTKDLTGGASPLAQGGLAAALGPGDSAKAHARDTEVAGAGLCDRETVAALAAGSPAAIEWLVSRGARLERQDLRLEGGHGKKRIVHSGDDASGAEVHRALVAALLASPVEVLDHAVALDLVIEDNGDAAGRRAAGLAVLAGGGGLPGEYRGGSHSYRSVGAGSSVGGEPRGGGRPEAGMVLARAVVIAAGGLGQAFATTSNPAGATGDGITLAARAGAVLRDLEFVQFHPTVLWSAGALGQRPLITEALRGAGAVLRDLDGRPVMAGRHPLGDLAPRDIVAAAMHEVITGAGTEHAAHLWLDATALGRNALEDGFPTVTKACREQGVDPVADYIPVAPGAHYSCGGIAADLNGRTSIPGLYAVGEAASTGVHGANRLASNSLVEAVIMGRNAGMSISATLTHKDSRMVDYLWREGGWRDGVGWRGEGGWQDGYGWRGEGRWRDGDGWRGEDGWRDGGDWLGSGSLGSGDWRGGAARSKSGWRGGIAEQDGGCWRGVSNWQDGGDRWDRDDWAHGMPGAGGGARGAAGAADAGVPNGNCGFLGDYRGKGHSYWGVGGAREGYPGVGAAEGGGYEGRDRQRGAVSRAALAAAMSRYAGVVRDREGLMELLCIAAGMPGGTTEAAVLAMTLRGAGLALGRGNGELAPGVAGEGNGVGLDVLEAASLRAVSVLIAAGALQRTESRGCHRRRDAPQTWARVRHTLMRWTPDGLAVTMR